VSITETETGPPTWRLLLGYVRPHRWTLLAGAVLSLLTGATGLLLPLVARELIDDLSHDRTITGALFVMSGLVRWARWVRTCCGAPRSPWCSARGARCRRICCDCASRPWTAPNPAT
jgi:hypothetical protein